MTTMQLSWTGPFQVKAYMTAAIDRTAVWEKRWPPPGDGVYLISRYRWFRRPTVAAEPLYVGGNTGRKPRFCTRVGDLVADLFGFFAPTGHHSGGQTLWHWCNANRVHPGNLWLAWTTAGTPWCASCAEIHVFETFPKAPKGDMRSSGLRNKRRPPRCRIHPYSPNRGASSHARR